MTFKVINRRDIIKRVLTRWDEQYPFERNFPDGSKASEIRGRLAKLDLATCSPDEVDEAIGNGSWTKQECDHCCNPRDVLVRVGEIFETEADKVDLCEACLIEALEALQDAAP